MALTTAKIPLNLRYHLENIINDYFGQEVTLIENVKTLDGAGRTISETSTESDVIVMIGTVNQNVIAENIGAVKTGDLLVYAMSDTGIIVGEQSTESEIRINHIKYEGVLYNIVDRVKQAFDPGLPTNPVVDKFIARKAPYE